MHTLFHEEILLRNQVTVRSCLKDRDIETYNRTATNAETSTDLTTTSVMLNIQKLAMGDWEEYN